MHIEIEEIGLDDEQERKSAISRIEEGQGQSKKELIDKDSKMFERFTAISPGRFMCSKLDYIFYFPIILGF